MKLEVIAYTIDDAWNAEKGGADRIELVSGMLEGGLTPSYAMLKEVLKQVSIPVHVMIRPHSLSFSYDEKDIQVMVHDIECVKQLGAAGVVMGTVTKGAIDRRALERLLKHTDHLSVTFHRAFDEVTNQAEALGVLLQYKEINRILTSGKKERVYDAVEQIRKLVGLTEGTSLSILPGSGLHVSGIRDFVQQTGVKELHFGQGVRVNGILSPVSPGKINKIKEALR